MVNSYGWIKDMVEMCEELDLIPSGALTKVFIERSDYFHFYKIDTHYGKIYPSKSCQYIFFDL